MARKQTIASAKPPEDSECRCRPEGAEGIECPNCGEDTLEFKWYSWDNNGHEFEHWVCSSCKRESNF